MVTLLSPVPWDIFTPLVTIIYPLCPHTLWGRIFLLHLLCEKSTGSSSLYPGWILAWPSWTVHFANESDWLRNEYIIYENQNNSMRHLRTSWNGSCSQLELKRIISPVSDEQDLHRESRKEALGKIYVLFKSLHLFYSLCLVSYMKPYILCVLNSTFSHGFSVSSPSSYV